MNDVVVMKVGTLNSVRDGHVIVRDEPCGCLNEHTYVEKLEAQL